MNTFKDKKIIDTLVINQTFNLMFAGMIFPFASNLIPNGWLLCNGQAISRETYSNLFAKIGTTFGAGDNSTTFNLPDKRDFIGIGKNGSGGNYGNLNYSTGVWDHTHTAQPHTHEYPHYHIVAGHTHEIPQHNHDISHTHSFAIHSHLMSHYHGFASHTHTGSVGTVSGTNVARTSLGTYDACDDNHSHHYTSSNPSTTQTGTYSGRTGDKAEITTQTATINSDNILAFNSSSVGGNTSITEDLSEEITETFQTNNPPVLFLNFIIKY